MPKTTHKNKPSSRKGKKYMPVAQQKMPHSSVSTDIQKDNWLSTDEVTAAFNIAVQQDIARKQKKGLPIARYDIESQRAYLENADGTKEYV